MQTDVSVKAALAELIEVMPRPSLVRLESVHSPASTSTGSRPLSPTLPDPTPARRR